MLLMKKVYFDAIRDGRKTTTLRFWKRPFLQDGSIHHVPGLGPVRIDAVREVEDMDRLTEQDARADGFESLADLREALDRLYPPEQRDGRRLYQVRFTYPA